jgi:PqqD family protein of HPr-rel-A system
MKEGLISWSFNARIVEVCLFADGVAAFHAGSGQTHWLGGALGRILKVLFESRCAVDAVDIHESLGALLAEPCDMPALAEVESGLDQLQRLGLIHEAHPCA